MEHTVVLGIFGGFRGGDFVVSAKNICRVLIGISMVVYLLAAFFSMQNGIIFHNLGMLALGTLEGLRLLNFAQYASLLGGIAFLLILLNLVPLVNPITRKSWLLVSGIFGLIIAVVVLAISGMLIVLGPAVLVSGAILNIITFIVALKWLK